MEGGIKPKVGEKVTVNYLITRRGKWIAYKLEKRGKAERGRTTDRAVTPLGRDPADFVASIGLVDLTRRARPRT
jgi:hypothetical protein